MKLRQQLKVEKRKFLAKQYEPLLFAICGSDSNVIKSYIFFLLLIDTFIIIVCNLLTKDTQFRF